MGAGHMIYGESSHGEGHMISEGCPMTGGRLLYRRVGNNSATYSSTFTYEEMWYGPVLTGNQKSEHTFQSFNAHRRNSMLQRPRVSLTKHSDLKAQR